MTINKRRNRVLVSTNLNVFNSKLLKSLRLGQPYSRNKYSKRKVLSKGLLGLRVGVSGRQIGRYESICGDKQFPKLKVLKRLCIYLQVDPKDLLGLSWIDEKLVKDGELIIDPENSFQIGDTRCSLCNQILIDYRPLKNKYLKRANKKILINNVRSNNE